ncbi:hypothetical protein A3F19_00915 [Candidatus Nomurabacteria bacterium RIFCSPHIGHO2_12_FULL_37_29]|uniref:Uncharacterized protein n=2 Tax=Candidatus Nomuraibacteriota TaxID=1752729 RepID=A0A1F6Y2P3_9BACT|nr:MAG: hypothetical protein A3F19_00915 [Candidatus Nomurabacteria bacterium RIFCSPHIGHO2_12_FULL_37_29]OGJ00643.1 MAG: hypothetical protein A3G98_00170 [Candidatus Nomurabacteria bacterium RIFCSPLOWO2_12_FULL_37_8]
MKEGGLFNQAIETLTGHKHPNVQKRKDLVQEIKALQERLKGLEDNLALPYEGLERPLYNGESVAAKIETQISDKEKKLENLMR